MQLELTPDSRLPGVGRHPTADRGFPIASLLPSPLVADASTAVLEQPGTGSDAAAGISGARLRDSFGRAITDLRISVTDRCNYKCVYCRTGNEGAQYTELPIAEYVRMVRILVTLGIEKVRLTGGEPLLRSGLAEMVSALAGLRTAYRHDGTRIEAGEAGQPLDLALTTNGHLLESLAAPLKAAGLDRVTVSMDAVEAEIFARITRVPRSFERVLARGHAAHAA